MKNLEPITSDVDAVVAQLRDFKVFILSCNIYATVCMQTHTDTRDSKQMERENEAN